MKIRLFISVIILALVITAGVSSRASATVIGPFDWCLGAVTEIHSGDQVVYSGIKDAPVLASTLPLSGGQLYGIGGGTPDKCKKSCPDGTVVIGSSYDMGNTVTFPECPGNDHKRNPPPTVTVVSGQSLDISYGNCGVHMPNPPYGGSATLGRIAKSAFPKMDFYQDVCSLSFFDVDGNPLTQGLGSLTFYFNLNQTKLDLFKAGKLDIYYFDGTSWKACNTTDANLIPVDRLTCNATNATTFALGPK